MLPKMSAHNALIIEKLIWSADFPTVFLFGSIEAQTWTMRRCSMRAVSGGDDTPVFWCPYPGIQLSTFMMFDHIIVHPSFDPRNMDHSRWYMQDVDPHMSIGHRTSRLA